MARCRGGERDLCEEPLHREPVRRRPEGAADAAQDAEPASPANRATGEHEVLSTAPSYGMAVQFGLRVERVNGDEPGGRPKPDHLVLGICKESRTVPGHDPPATDCREEAIDGERCEAIDLPPPGATDFL